MTDKTIEAMREAYKFGECAGPLQDPMELAYAVAREAVLEEALRKIADIPTSRALGREKGLDDAYRVVEAMKGPDA